MTRLCLPHICATAVTSCSWASSRAGRRTRTPPRTSRRSSGCAVSSTRCARTLLGRPIRITTVDAGLVETEFSLVRFRGDEEHGRTRCTTGVDPITPDEVADCVMFALTRPLHVNVDEIVIKALRQSSGARVVRRTTA